MAINRLIGVINRLVDAVYNAIFVPIIMAHSSRHDKVEFSLATELSAGPCLPGAPRLRD